MREGLERKEQNKVEEDAPIKMDSTKEGSLVWNNA
jgi:hypothetical protein